MLPKVLHCLRMRSRLRVFSTVSFVQFENWATRWAGSTRTALAIGCVFVGIPLWYTETRKTRMALESIGKVQSCATKSIENAETFETVLSLDKMMRRPDIVSGRKLLVASSFSIPSTGEQRRPLLDYADAVANAGLALRLVAPEIIAEKYGAYVERVLANPYLQDQFLSNPARWGSVVTLGNAVFEAKSDGAPIESDVRKEAKAFLAGFDIQTAACEKTRANAKQVPGTDYYLKCQYANDTMVRNKAVAK